ncbi:hypothetical protein ScPMuIL_014034 [Solemya velum]
MGNGPITCPTTSVEGGQLKTYLTKRQIQLVQETWDILKEDSTKLGVTVFLRLFETEADLKSLFPKIVRMNENNELEWYLDREMLQKHAVTVMEGLGAAVDSLEESNFFNSVLMSIGQTHNKRNVKPQMLKRLWPSLNYGFKSYLGPKYTKEVSEAWRKVYMYICLQMRRGMDSTQSAKAEEDLMS